MEKMQGQWWNKYFEVATDAEPDYVKYVGKIKAIIDKNPENATENLKIIAANNLMPSQILDGMLSDKNCPQELFDGAFEGVLQPNAKIKEQFFQIISKPNAPKVVLKNCGELTDRLTFADIREMTEKLLKNPRNHEDALNTLVKLSFSNPENKGEDLGRLLSHPDMPPKVLRFGASQLYQISDPETTKNLSAAIMNHPNFNSVIAKVLVDGTCRHPSQEEALKTDVNVSLLQDMMRHTPSNKGVLTAGIALLPHIENKEQQTAICRAILENKCCTQDVVKTLLHKMSYTEYFEDACQMVFQNNLATRSVKAKIENLKQQYPIRLALERKKRTLASFIKHPEKIPADFPAEELKTLAAEACRYSGLELKFEHKTKLCEAIVAHPNCKADVYAYIVQKIPTMGDAVLSEMRKGKQEALEGWNHYKNLKTYKRDLYPLTSERYDAEKMGKFIREAGRVVRSGNQAEIQSFKEKLFSAGEDSVYKLDHNAVNWFIKNGKPENLEALNCLRGLYGLETVVEEFSHTDPDKTDAKRMLFGGEVSAVNKYVDMETGELNEHYARKHSKEFMEYRPDMSRDYRPEDYDFDTQKSWQKMAQEGVHLPTEKMAETFAQMHMRKEIFENLNATDLIHYFLESQGLDVEKGSAYKLKDFTTSTADSVRENYWKKIADNEQMVDFISADLWRKGMTQESIDQIWENCRNYGSPTRGEDGKMNVFGISLQIHHCRALKDGGENADDNFIVVISTEHDSTSTVKLNSHKPLHEYDNPGVSLYLDNKGNVTPSAAGGHRIKILTFPAGKCKNGERVAVYNGPSPESCCIVNKEGNVRPADYSMPRAKTQTADYRMLMNTTKAERV